MPDAATGDSLDATDTILGATLASEGAGHSPTPRGAPSELPARIGRFVVLRELGRGGMGIVYAAYDNDLERRVAIKVLHRAEARAAERMRREAQAMAKIVHPNVASIHEVGQWNGQTFLAMEFVDGVSLKAWLREEQRSLAEVVDVMLQAGEGLLAAHAAGLVHRDFKPDNMMVGRDGRVRVLDFGLAGAGTKGPGLTDAEVEAAMSERGSEIVSNNALDTPLTETGAMMGTPAYMSPEQYFGRDSGPASDQFSFAVTFFEAVYGERPFKGGSVAGLGLAASQGRIEPAPSGTAVPHAVYPVLKQGLAPKAAGRHADLRGLMDALIAAFDAPARRRRRRRGLALALAGVGGLALTGLYVQSVAEERTQARAAAEREAANAEAARRAEAKQQARREAAELAGHNALLRSVAAAAEVSSVQAAALRESAGPDPFRSGLASEELLGAMTMRSWSQQVLLPQDPAGRRRPHDYATSPDGEWIARGYEDGTVTLTSVDGHALSPSLPPTDESVYRVAVCDDARRIAGTALFDRAVLWNNGPEGVEGPIDVPFGHRIKSLTFDPGCARLSLGSQDGAIRIVDLEGDAPPLDLKAPRGIIGQDFSPDGKLLAVTSGDDVLVFDLSAGTERTFRGHGAGVRYVHFSNDGRRLVSAGLDDTVRLWTLDGSEPPAMFAHDLQMSRACFSADDRWLITSSLRGRLYVWDLTDPDDPHQILDAGPRVLCARGRMQFNSGPRIFRRDSSGARIVATEGWTSDTRHGEVLRSSPVAFSPDGSSFASTTYVMRGYGPWGVDYFGDSRFFRGGQKLESDQKPRHHTIVRVVPVHDPGAPVRIFPIHGLHWILATAFTPDGRRVAAAATDGSLRVWDAHDPAQKPWQVITPSPLHTLAIHPDGTHVATAGEDHVIRIWDLEGPPDQAPRELSGHEDTVWSISWSPDGDRLSTSSRDGTVRLWTADGSSPPAVLARTHPHLMRAPFSPDGSMVASSSVDHVVQLHPVEDPDRVRRLEGHEADVSTLAFSADGRRLVSGSRDQTARVWHLDGSPPLVLEGHLGEVVHAAISPDGRTVASASNDGTVRVWDLEAGPHDPLVLPTRGGASFVTFSPDGRHLGTNAKNALVWDLQAWEHPRTSMWRQPHCESVEQRREQLGESENVALRHRARCVELTQFCREATLDDCHSRVEATFGTYDPRY